MSAQPEFPEPCLVPMTHAWLDAVASVEQTAYTHPWSRLNFADSLAAGYQAQVLARGDALLGYFVALHAVDHVHLLNLTVAPPHQRQGWARVLLDALALWSLQKQAQWLWLEVRASNARAQQVYLRRGFVRVGQRKGYYPAPGGKREDALVMSLKL